MLLHALPPHKLLSIKLLDSAWTSSVLHFCWTQSAQPCPPASLRRSDVLIISFWNSMSLGALLSCEECVLCSGQLDHHDPVRCLSKHAGATYLNEGKLHVLSFLIAPPQIGLHVEDSQPSLLQLLQDVQHVAGSWLCRAAVPRMPFVTLLAVQLHLQAMWHSAGLRWYSISLSSG